MYLSISFLNIPEFYLNSQLKIPLVLRKWLIPFPCRDAKINFKFKVLYKYQFFNLPSINQVCNFKFPFIFNILRLFSSGDIIPFIHTTLAYSSMGDKPGQITRWRPNSTDATSTHVLTIFLPSVSSIKFTSSTPFSPASSATTKQVAVHGIADIESGVNLFANRVQGQNVV